MALLIDNIDYREIVFDEVDIKKIYFNEEPYWAKHYKIVNNISTDENISDLYSIGFIGTRSASHYQKSSITKLSIGSDIYHGDQLSAITVYIAPSLTNKLEYEIKDIKINDLSPYNSVNDSTIYEFKDIPDVVSDMILTGHLTYWSTPYKLQSLNESTHSQVECSVVGSEVPISTPRILSENSEIYLNDKLELKINLDTNYKLEYFKIRNLDGTYTQILSNRKDSPIVYNDESYLKIDRSKLGQFQISTKQMTWKTIWTGSKSTGFMGHKDSDVIELQDTGILLGSYNGVPLSRVSGKITFGSKTNQSKTATFTAVNSWSGSLTYAALTSKFTMNRGENMSFVTFYQEGSYHSKGYIEKVEIFD